MPKRKSARPRRSASLGSELPASAIDKHVGARIRMGRKLCGMNMKHLAMLLNLTYQQVQKYEKGHNRISAGRLYALSRILNVPIIFFFENMAKQGSVASDDEAGGGGEVMDDMNKRETLELMRAFFRINHPRVRKEILALAKLLGEPHKT